MFNELKIPMARVLKMTVSGSGNTYAEAVTDMFSEGNLNKMEKKIDGWKVKTSVYDVKPIIAKVGKKRALKTVIDIALFLSKRIKKDNWLW